MADSKRIGPYRVIRKLGAGGMGEVLLAHDDRLDRLVAIKRLHNDHAATPDRRERFRREAKIAARLNHPAIVQIHDVLHQGDDDYLIMEYIDGRTLRERRAAAMTVSEVIGIAHQIALGMATAHDLGIIHRDLKAENVLITSAGLAKITDFGIAKLHGEDTLTAEGAVIGTFRAMSPEQALGRALDHRSDLFSFGILLYEAVADESPFIAETPFLTVLRLVADAPQPITELVPSIPSNLASLIHQLLAKDPLLRPRDFHEVAAALIELAGQACDVPCRAGSPPGGRPLNEALITTQLQLGATLDPAGPDAEEREAMRRLGAASVELFRRYRRVLHAFHATSLPDLPALAAAVREILAEDPAWAHAYALLAVIEGQSTDAARDVLAAARVAVSAARDLSGMQLLGALELSARGEPEAALQAAGGVLRQDRADLLAAHVLSSWALLARRSEESLAIAQPLHAAFPELSFGMNIAEVLRWEGRDGDADRVIREWARAAPGSLPARVELVRLEANAGRLDEARARTREVIAIHGHRDDALPDLFEVLVASDQISEARAIADRMLAGSPLARARGRYRVAVTSLFEGRFAAAYDAARRAIAEHRAFGMQSELTQCLELARSIAPLVGDVDAQRRYTDELAVVLEAMVGDAGAAAALRFELALLDRGDAAPSIEAHLAGLEDGPVRDVARRRMLRVAALASAGSVHEAVAAGFSTCEENTASLVALGLCARRMGELPLARRSFEGAVQRWSSVTSNQSSPYHAVLARFHLAGVLDELGEHAEARAAYEAFLRCWSDPDRPIPEVAVARRKLDLATRPGVVLTTSVEAQPSEGRRWPPRER
jgi:predicted Ser/Thr protein kinase